MTTRPSTIDQLLDYWPGNIPFKTKLVSDDGCMCAQAQALHFLGNLTVNEIRAMGQADADRRVAKLFGISLAHSVLLRIVNDGQKGAPSSVIRNPEQVLGDQAHAVLAFWRHLDCMTPAAWAPVKAATEAAAEAATIAKRTAEAAAEAAAGGTAKVAAWGAAMASAMVVPSSRPNAAAYASNEIQGAAVMCANNKPFFYLPLFGFSDPQAVIDASETNTTC
jgi:hypothetical protein